MRSAQTEMQDVQCAKAQPVEGRTYRRVLALVCAGSVCALLCAISRAPLRSLSEYGDFGKLYAGALVAAGVLVAVGVYVCLMMAARRRMSFVMAVSVYMIAVSAPFASMWCPGRITHYQYGLTVYGLIPVPLLDICVNARGWLGVRDKTHWVTLEEVRRVMTDETDVLIIGTGCDGAVRVAPEVERLRGVEVHIMTTPAAVEFFNRCKREGKRTAIILHSTC